MKLSWKTKRLIKKLFSYVLLGAIAWGGYHYYQQGTFKRGIGPGFHKIVASIPYFGSRYRHFIVKNYGSRAYYGKKKSYKGKRRSGKKRSYTYRGKKRGKKYRGKRRYKKSYKRRHKKGRRKRR